MTEGDRLHCLPLADDCGASEGNVAAIMACLDAGTLRGCSILAGGPAALQAAEGLAARRSRDAGILAGVHLNLIEGQCCAPPQLVPLLADAKGRFRYSLPAFLVQLFLCSKKKRSTLLEQVYLEWDAQIERVTELLARFGYNRDIPLYLDGHQHMHAVPALQPAMRRICATRRIAHVRVPFELPYAMPAGMALRFAGTLRRAVLSHWGRALRGLLQQQGIACPEYFVGAYASASLTLERVEAGLTFVAAKNNHREAVVEIMLHPGGYSAKERQEGKKPDPYLEFYALPEREEEKRMMLSPDFLQLLARFDPGYERPSAPRGGEYPA